MDQEQENVYGIAVKLTPWGEKGYMVSNLHMFECLGGDLAYGEMELWCPDNDEAKQMITEQQTGEIELQDTKDGGLTYKIPFFIDSRSFFENILKVKFTCIKDKKFYTDRISLEHSDINKAIESLYPGKKGENIDIRTKSDINNNIPIYQTDETNYSLCKKLAYSYKKDSVFTFGMEGFMIKDTIGKNSLGEDENSHSLELINGFEMNNTKMYKLNYNRVLNTTPFNPWEDKEDSATGNKDYKDLEPINCRALINYTSYSIMGTDYYQLENNYQYNYNFLNSDYFTSFTITGVHMPNYKIGDIITYKEALQKTSYPFTKFIVASNEVFFSSQNGSSRLGPYGNPFEWSSTLLGIEPGKWSEENKS